MKLKILVATLLGCLVSQQGVLSQSDTIATDINQSGMGASTAVSSSATSSVAALTVVFPPSIAKQPANQTVVNGNDATLNVTARGTLPLSYQWYFNGNPISEATDAIYTITGITASNEGNYTVLVSNACGTVTSGVAALTVVFPPSIAAQPAGQMVVNGGIATFTVSAEGTPPLNYQWYFNGNPIDGATDTSYTITGVTTNNEGNYTVVVTNSCGSVTSSNIVVDTSASNPPVAAASTEAAGSSATPAVGANVAPSAATGIETTGANTANPSATPAVGVSVSPGATAGTETTGGNAANPSVTPAIGANVSPGATAGTETTGGNAANPSATSAVDANVSSGTASGAETTGANAANPATTTAATAGESSAATGTNGSVGASAATPTVTTTVSTNESASVTATNETASAAKTQSTAPQSIPLIQFQDVPITTAIENLARQAGINYLIDPKIGYGQPDQNGQIKAEPTLSIRWENVTAEQALMALLDNYNLQLIADRKTQIARITTKDPTAPPPLSTRVIQLKYASTSNMVDSVQASLTDKRSKVLPDARTSQLVVVATENEQEAVDTLVNQLDRPTRQVLIETKLVQVSSNPTTKKGVDWTGTLQAQSVSFGNGAIVPSASSTTANFPGTSSGSGTTPGGGYPTGSGSSEQTVLNIIQGAGGVSWNTASGFTPGIGFLNASGANAVLSFLNAAYDAKIVSTPRIVTLDNQTATIEVTRGYPIINLSGGTQNSSGSSSITYSNVGTILEVTPRISANDYIWLKVLPIVSSHFGDITVTVQGGQGNPSSSYPVPEFDYRKMDSQVMIPNGNTLVMGGLVQNNPTASYSKVPLLGDIPGLGWAFRSESKSMSKDNLIIFLTPTIIKDTDFQPASADSAKYLQSKVPVIKSPMNPNTAWDGAEPRGDWSNPAPETGEFDK